MEGLSWPMGVAGAWNQEPRISTTVKGILPFDHRLAHATGNSTRAPT